MNNPFSLFVRHVVRDGFSASVPGARGSMENMTATGCVQHSWRECLDI